MSELIGAELDAAVAKALGMEWLGPDWLGWRDSDGAIIAGVHWMPSDDWSQGGPIIERERITIEYLGIEWWGQTPAGDRLRMDPWNGETPLIAAMRAFVASKA